MAIKRGYVAVNMRIDPRNGKIEITACQDMTIEGANGASMTLKKGEKFVAVRAASLGKNMWYIVCSVTGFKKCTYSVTKPCAHEIHIATGRSLAELRAEVGAHKAAKSCKAKVAKAIANKLDETKTDVSSTIQPIELPKVTSADLGAPANLNGTPQSDPMSAWLAILPSRQKAIA